MIEKILAREWFVYVAFGAYIFMLAIFVSESKEISDSFLK